VRQKGEFSFQVRGEPCLGGVDLGEAFALGEMEIFINPDCCIDRMIATQDTGDGQGTPGLMCSLLQRLRAARSSLCSRPTFDPELPAFRPSLQAVYENNWKRFHGRIGTPFGSAIHHSAKQSNCPFKIGLFNIHLF
jgi:hypothetical protein